MANILEFIRELLTDSTAQEMFLSTPHEYLESFGFTDLSGEDVVEAIMVVRRNLPDGLATALAVYEGEAENMPAVRPVVGESDLDAAVRQLTHATLLARDGSSSVDMHTIEEGTTVADPKPEPAVADREPDRATEPAPAGGSAHEPAGGNTLGEIYDEAAARLADVLEQTQARLADALHQASVEADAIRRAAEADATNMRQLAAQESDAMLDAAKAEREEARERAAALVEEAEAKAASLVSDAEMRRDAIRDAERRLREQLLGVQSVVQEWQEANPGDG